MQFRISHCVQCCCSLLLLLLLLQQQLHAARVKSEKSRRQLLLVSLDGFRHDYFDIHAEKLVFLRNLAKNSVFVRKLKTEFTTKTFPSHWSIVTGRHQESHGIVSNSMFDPQFNDTFSMTNHQERWWNDTEPIWITAKRQGLKSATYFWPGSEVQFQGVRPDHYFRYDGRVNFAHRVQVVIDWIVNQKIDFCTLYYDEPDSMGHRYGHASSQVGEKLAEIDSFMSYLFYLLEINQYLDKVDVIITSDHGMATVNSSRIINFNNTLNQYVDRYIDTGALFTMFAKAGMQQQLVDQLLSKKQNEKLQYRVFTRDTMPKELHYSEHRRIPDVIVLPENGYLVLPRSRSYVIGNHGYDNNYNSMQVPLIATGPSFKRQVEVKGLRQVDIYGLMCQLLKLQPLANNGSTELFKQMLDSAATAAAPAAMHLCSLCAAAVVVRKFF